MQKDSLDSSKIKILICCHKPCELPKDDIFLPIQVGATISDIDLGMQRDDQVNGEACDNISAKNKSYCELTAMYWAWKNIKKLYPDLEYIGLNHYRRYFAFDKRNFLDDAIVRSEKDVISYRLNHRRLADILLHGKALVSKPRHYPYPLHIDYCVSHVSYDFRMMRKIIHDVCPDYDLAFYSVMMRNNALSPYNMFVIGWADFESYCTWLFKILGEAEKRINIENYSNVQKRIFGYMAERLLNVWLYKNRLKTRKLNIYKFTDSEWQLRGMKKVCKNILSAVSFFAQKPHRKKIANLAWYTETI